MKSSTRYSIAGLAFVTLGASGAVRWNAAAPMVERQPAVVGVIRGTTEPPADSVLQSAEEFLVSNDPFRLSNAPPANRFNPANETGAGVIGAPPPVFRPSFSLKAIVGGPPWQAIVDGIPGQPPSTSVHAGSTFDKLTVRAVTRDSVIIQGPDTAWVLSFRKLP